VRKVSYAYVYAYACVASEDRALIEGYPCIRLVRGKFELTNQDSAGGKNSGVLMLRSQEKH